jgi:hypothetical protein
MDTKSNEKRKRPSEGEYKEDSLSAHSTDPWESSLESSTDEYRITKEDEEEKNSQSDDGGTKRKVKRTKLDLSGQSTSGTCVNDAKKGVEANSAASAQPGSHDEGEEQQINRKKASKQRKTASAPKEAKPKTSKKKKDAPVRLSEKAKAFVVESTHKLFDDCKYSLVLLKRAKKTTNVLSAFS